MIPFEHTGPERPAVRWVRNALLGLFLTIGAILLFPFTLLMLLVRGVAYVGNARPLLR